MSHESMGPYGTALYAMPSAPSDVLRSIRFRQFFAGYRGAPFSVTTGDGWFWRSTLLRRPAFTAAFRTRERLDAVMDGSIDPRRAFLNGDIEIRGEGVVLLAVAEYVLANGTGLSGNLLHALGRATVEISRRVRKSPGRNWRSVACPTQLPAEFFEGWLGESLSHVCGIFGAEADTLSRAQAAGLERVCHTLELEGGDRLLEVGAAWGGLVIHAGQRYRASVHGVTGSEEQAETTAARIANLGLHGQCTVSCRDLRAAPFRPESFDKVADVGIFEQTESRDLRSYLTCVGRAIVPGGLLLLHRVTRSPAAREHWAASLQADLLNAGLTTLSRELEVVESVGLEIVQVESIQADYEITLRRWIGHLQASLDGSQATGRGAREWLLYLVETVASLQAGELQIHRMLLRKLPTGAGRVYRCSSQKASGGGPLI